MIAELKIIYYIFTKVYLIISDMDANKCFITPWYFSLCLVTARCYKRWMLLIYTLLRNTGLLKRILEADKRYQEWKSEHSICIRRLAEGFEIAWQSPAVYFRMGSGLFSNYHNYKSDINREPRLNRTDRTNCKSITQVSIL